MITDSRTITIFLASSEELMNDRNAICVMIKEIDEILEPQGIRIYCKRWEDFIAHCTGSRTQDDYDRVLQNCDICLCLFHHKAGQYTVEEFKEAIKAYKKIHKPLPLVYMRDISDGDTEDDTLKEFKNELSTQGDSWENYANVYELQEMFLQRLGQFMIENKLQSDISNIKVESGTVLYNGCEIANVSGQDKVVSENTCTITIFLASSNELDDDCMCFRYLVASLDSIYEPRGIRIRCRNWKKFNPNGTEERKQSEYDTVTNASDISICMFHREANKNTLDEFYQSLDAYNRNGDHPKTYVYIRALVDGEIEDAELAQFKKDLYDNMGHYWCNYATEDYMRLHFVMQFERLLNGESIPGGESNLKVQQGNLLLYGKKIADYANIPFAANNAEVIALKNKIAALDKDITTLSSLCNETLLPIINEKLVESHQLREQLEQLDKQLLDTALSISNIISSGNPISERKRLAIEMFEKGNHQEVDNVLNEKEIKYDCQLIKQRIVQLEKQDALIKDKIECAKANLRSCIDEYILKAKNVMSLYSNPNRYEEACKLYESAIKETREGLQDNDIAVRLVEYGYFLFTHKQYTHVEPYYQEALAIYERLATNNSEMYELARSVILHLLAMFYYETKRFNKADNYCQRALTLTCLVVANNPTMLNLLAAVLNSLANLYSDRNDFVNAEKKYLRALSIVEHMATNQPNAYESDLATILNNLGLLYKNTEREKESESYYLRALSIRERLAASNPTAHESDLAQTLNNLAALYYTTKRLSESESYYLRALSIRERLAASNPTAHEFDLAQTLHNLALLYSTTNQIKEAEKKYLRALSIRERLAASHSNANEFDLADTLNNLATLYLVMGCKVESEKYVLRALSICERGVKNNHNVYDSLLAQILSNLSMLYLEKNRFIDAEKCCLQSIKIFEKLIKKSICGVEPYLLSSLNTLSLLYHETKQIKKSQKYCLRAITICEQLLVRFPEVYAITLQSLKENYKELQNISNNTMSNNTPRLKIIQ